MNTMIFIVWMLPVIFMLHDFEEIMMAEVWVKRYRAKINSVWPKRQPFALKYVHHCQTPTFSIAVEIEFLLFSLFSWFSVACQNYFVWYSAFLAFTLHLVLHILLLCVQFKNYVPGVITSAIFILPSIWFLYSAEKILSYNMTTIFLAFLLGIALLVIVLPILHKLCGPLSQWLYKYSQSESDK